MSDFPEPKPYTLEFSDNESAFGKIIGFQFHPSDREIRHLEGWIVARIDEPSRIVQARMCAPFVGYVPSEARISLDGKRVPPVMPESFCDLRRTVPEWKEAFPDSLVTELSQSSASREVLQRLLDGAPNYFADLRIMRAKPQPWSEQDFLDAEASIATIVTYKPSRWLGYYGREHIARAARAGREPEEITAAQRRLKQLQELAYQAAESLRDRLLPYRSWKGPTKEYNTVFEEENSLWMDRLRVECPGFSDWVYHDAINDWGFHMAR